MTDTLWIQDPEAVLDYQFDWSDWLDVNEAIGTVDVTATEGLTVGTTSEAAGVVTVWLSGGVEGSYYEVRCEITTDAGRTDARTRIMLIKRT